MVDDVVVLDKEVVVMEVIDLVVVVTGVDDLVVVTVVDVKIEVVVEDCLMDDLVRFVTYHQPDFGHQS